MEVEDTPRFIISRLIISRYY